MVVVEMGSLNGSGEDDDKNDKKMPINTTVPRKKERFRKLRLRQKTPSIGQYQLLFWLVLPFHIIFLSSFNHTRIYTRRPIGVETSEPIEEIQKRRKFKCCCTAKNRATGKSNAKTKGKSQITYGIICYFWSILTFGLWANLRNFLFVF